jgi:hypothetical protein
MGQNIEGKEIVPMGLRNESHLDDDSDGIEKVSLSPNVSTERRRKRRSWRSDVRTSMSKILGVNSSSEEASSVCESQRTLSMSDSSVEFITSIDSPPFTPESTRVSKKVASVDVKSLRLLSLVKSKTVATTNKGCEKQEDTRCLVESDLQTISQSTTALDLEEESNKDSNNILPSSSLEDIHFEQAVDDQEEGACAGGAEEKQRGHIEQQQANEKLASACGAADDEQAEADKSSRLVVQPAEAGASLSIEDELFQLPGLPENESLSECHWDEKMAAQPGTFQSMAMSMPSLLTSNKSMGNSPKRRSRQSVTFSESVDSKSIAALIDDVDHLYYKSDEIAEFRYEAFMEKIGLDPKDFD